MNKTSLIRAKLTSPLELTPTISNDPVFVALVVHSPPNDGNNVIHDHVHHAPGLDHAALVFHERIGIYAGLQSAKERTPDEDLN
jgi:hypothetical protein